MSATELHAPLSSTASAAPVVDMVVPVHNEQHVLAESIAELHAAMSGLGLPFRITIADNASTDGTLELARLLAAQRPHVEVRHLGEKGRGRALREAWMRSDATVVAYTDVDLSSDLRALPDLLLPLVADRADMAIGTRLAPGSQVRRSLRREVISRSYNILLRASLGIGISDAQCGFKAARRAAILPLLERVQDDSWFFDSELLYLAGRGKLAIREVPVCWVEDPDSRVDLLATARDDLRGIARLRRASRARRPACADAMLAPAAGTPRPRTAAESPRRARAVAH